MLFTTLGLRICSGAFRTSPIESIYVDSNELPLDLRREELGLRYMMRVKSALKNPSHRIFKHSSESSKFTAPRSSKPLQVRVNEELSDDTLRAQKVLTVRHPPNPSWLVPRVSICENKISKKNYHQRRSKPSSWSMMSSIKTKSKFTLMGPSQIMVLALLFSMGIIIRRKMA